MIRILSAIAAACIVFLAVSASGQHEIWIGTELGPEYILHDGFLDESQHEVFIDNQYFMQSLVDGGFTYNRGVTTLNFVYNGRTGCAAYAAVLADIDEIGLIAYPPDAGSFPSHRAWRSDRIMKKPLDSLRTNNDWDTPPPPPWDSKVGFWRPDPMRIAQGNSVTFIENDENESPALADYWLTDHNAGGFILGNPNDTTNSLDANWIRAAEHFVFRIQGTYKDYYKIWLLMKLADFGMAGNPNDTLLRFYIRDIDNATVDTTSVLAGDDSLITGEWHWVEMNPSIKFNGSGRKYKFALQWLGEPDAGEVKFARFAYQSMQNYSKYSGANSGEEKVSASERIKRCSEELKRLKPDFCPYNLKI